MTIYTKFQNSKNEWLESSPSGGPLTFTLDFNKAYSKKYDLDTITSLYDLAKEIYDVVINIINVSKSKKVNIIIVKDPMVNKPLLIYSANTDSDIILTMDILDDDLRLNMDDKDIYYQIGNYINDLLKDYIFKKHISSAMAKASEDLGIDLFGVSETSKSEDNVDDIIKFINTKTKATVSKPKETMADYVCNNTLKSELEEICDFFKNEKIYKDKNITIPKGILLKGEPGTGKTYAARCIAGTVESYFLHTTASALQGMYIGSGAENIKQLFKGARKLRDATDKGVFIFLDEIDSLGSRESHTGGGASGEEDRTLNQLLAELSGFDDDERIMVMAATNYPNRLDDALMRSGRFSRQITIDYPDENERYNLVKYYFSKIKMDLKDTNYNEIAFLTDSLSPADIKEISNEAAILAIRNNREDILLEDINEAINKVITKNIRNEDNIEDTELVAAHEAGHVLAELIFNKTVPIKVTNYSYGSAGGFTQSSRNRSGLQSSGDLGNRICILLGGRAAEEVMTGKITTGASNDLYKARNILKSYYETYMFEKYDVEKIDQIVIDDIFIYYQNVLETFNEHKEQLKAITNALISKRVLYKSDLIGIYTSNGGKI